MQPIVNGLETEYGTTIEFLSFNAQDGEDGEAYFQQTGLRGHPAILIYDATGVEQYRGIGVIDEAALQAELTTALVE